MNKPTQEEQIRAILTRYNARRHDKPNGFPRKDQRKPIDKATEEITQLLAESNLRARIDEIEWLQKNAPMYISGFLTGHIEESKIRNRQKRLKCQLTHSDKGEDK